MNWLAFLNRYKLHGILCDGILSEVLYEPVFASCHVLINEKLCHTVCLSVARHTNLLLKSGNRSVTECRDGRGELGGGGGPMFAYNPFRV